MAWIFAAYFAVAWLLLLGVIIRPEHVTRLMLAGGDGDRAGDAGTAGGHAGGRRCTPATRACGPSIYSIGLPEELAKAMPVLVVALIYRRRHGLTPRDYLFLGAVSGLVFGASEVVHYFTVNGVAQFYPTVQSAIPAIEQLISTGHSAPDLAVRRADRPGAVLHPRLRLAVRHRPDHPRLLVRPDRLLHRAGGDRRYRWYTVAWIGLVVAAILHGLNDWGRVNGHLLWILVVAGQRDPVPRLRQGRVPGGPRAAPVRRAAGVRPAARGGRARGPARGGASPPPGRRRGRASHPGRGVPGQARTALVGALTGPPGLRRRSAPVRLRRGETTDFRAVIDRLTGMRHRATRSRRSTAAGGSTATPAARPGRRLRTRELAAILSVAAALGLASCIGLSAKPPAARSPGPTADRSAPPAASPAGPTPGPTAAPTTGATAAGDPVTIAAVGDTMLGNTPNLPPDAEAYLDPVKHSLDSGAQIVFGNLEGTLTTATASKCGPKKSNKCFAFRNPPDYAGYLKDAGFTVLNNANNHSYDFGAAGRPRPSRPFTRQAWPRPGCPARSRWSGRTRSRWRSWRSPPMTTPPACSTCPRPGR